MCKQEISFKNNCIKFMRMKYFMLMKACDVELTDSTFSWCKNNFLNLYIIFIPSRFGPQFISFTCDSNDNKDHLMIKDIISKNSPKLNLLAEGSSKDTIKKLVVEHIIGRPNSLHMPIERMALGSNSPILSGIRKFDLNKYVKHFLNDRVQSLFYWEIDHEDNKYKQVDRMTLDLSPRSFFERTFGFKNVINGINNKQFTDELSECLFAYNRGKWFICSTSIGSILEELMFNIIKINRDYYEDKYNNRNTSQIQGYKRHLFKVTKSSYNKIIRHNQATAKDYEIVFQAPPIKATDRSMRLIQALFMVRNAVDHYNSGRTNRNLCDLLLHGIADMYNDYYIKMMDFKHKYDKK